MTYPINMESERTKLLAIMKSLLAGEIDCESAQSRVEALRMKEFPNLFASLYHCYTDEDIRARDPEYKEFQNKELEKLINHLIAGDIEKANEISFLHEPKST